MTAAAERNGFLPAGYCGLRNPSHLGSFQEHWVRQLYNYYKDMDILCCPLANQVDPRFRPPETKFALYPEGIGKTFVAWGSYVVFEDIPHIYGSYGYNAFCFNPEPGSLGDSMFGGVQAWRGTHVKGAYRVPLLVDCAWMDMNPAEWHLPPPAEDAFVPPYHATFDMRLHYACINRHEGYVHGGFMDGSMRKMGLKELWLFPWSRIFDTTIGPRGCTCCL